MRLKNPPKGKSKIKKNVGGIFGKYGRPNLTGGATTRGPRKPLPVLHRPGQPKSQTINAPARKPSGGVKPPVDYTSPANKGLVKAATPERQAAVASHLSKLNANKNLTGAQKSQRSNLLREQKKRGWA